MKRRSFLTGLIAAVCCPQWPAKAKSNPEFDTHIGFPYSIAYRNKKPVRAVWFVPKMEIQSRWVYPIELSGQQVNSPHEYVLTLMEELLQADSEIASVTILDGDYLFTLYRGGEGWQLIPAPEHSVEAHN